MISRIDMKSLQICAVLVLAVAASAQMDGGFWWLNKNVTAKAAASRSIREQSAKIRTLPPRYKKETDDQQPTTASTAIFVDEELEDSQRFKHDSEPDCVCTPKHLCNENHMINTDGIGIIDER